jgi:hypothetical protein
MREAGFDRHIGSANICSNINEALKRAEQIHSTPNISEIIQAGN